MAVGFFSSVLYVQATHRKWVHPNIEAIYTPIPATFQKRGTQTVNNRNATHFPATSQVRGTT